jgi:AraC-like DNA-binding protein
VGFYNGSVKYVGFAREACCCKQRRVKNDIRRDMAIELLSNSQVPLQDISTELNFHDPSAFHRAFKKWTGVSPGAYRQNKDA